MISPWLILGVAKVVCRLVNTSSFVSTKSASELEIAGGDGWVGMENVVDLYFSA